MFRSLKGVSTSAGKQYKNIMLYVVVFFVSLNRKSKLLFVVVVVFCCFFVVFLLLFLENGEQVLLVTNFPFIVVFIYATSFTNFYEFPILFSTVVVSFLIPS